MIRELIHKLSTVLKRAEPSEDVMGNVVLYYIRDPKRQSGVMIRQPAEFYRERREFRTFVSLQIFYYEMCLNRRKQNART